MTDSVTVHVNFGGEKDIAERWEPAKWHCPLCGEKRVWILNDPLYSYPLYLCLSCMASFRFHGLIEFQGSPEKSQRIAQLRAKEIPAPAPDVLYACRMALHYLILEGEPYLTVRAEDLIEHLRNAIKQATQESTDG